MTLGLKDLYYAVCTEADGAESYGTPNEALLAEDENAQLLEEKRVGRLIHAGNLQEVQNAIFKSFYRGTAGDNSDTENENDGEETTEEGNRAAVQEN